MFPGVGGGHCAAFVLPQSPGPRPRAAPPTCALLPLKQGQALPGHPAAHGSPTPSCRRHGDHPPCAGGHGGHTGGSQPWGWSAPRGVAQGLGSTCVHLWPGAGRRKQHILPGGIEAVVRADRVVPEELLAAVRTGVCTGREEKHHLEKSPPRRRDHAGPAGLSSTRLMRRETRPPGEKSGRKTRPGPGAPTLQNLGYTCEPQG